MSNSRVACYDTTSLGAEVEVTEGNPHSQRLVLPHANSDPTLQFQNTDIQQNEDGSDQCESGDSGEGYLTIPIYSVDTNYNLNENKGKRECSPPTDDDGGRKRVKFLPQHIKLLEELFLESQYPTTEVREKLEQQLGVPENRILVWFQNRRAKEKRETKRLQKIRTIRKQIDSKLLPPSFWPEDLSFDSPLRHIIPSERRSRTPAVLPTPTTISGVVEEFLPHNVLTRVPIQPARPITERNSSCSYQNCTVPLQNGIQYTANDGASIFPMTTVTYVPQPQTELPHWEDQICSNQSRVSYPYTISSYLPVEAQFHGQSYPWLGRNIVSNQVNAQANLCQNDEFANWQ